MSRYLNAIFVIKHALEIKIQQPLYDRPDFWVQYFWLNCQVEYQRISYENKRVKGLFAQNVQAWYAAQKSHPELYEASWRVPWGASAFHLTARCMRTCWLLSMGTRVQLFFGTCWQLCLGTCWQLSQGTWQQFSLGTWLHLLRNLVALHFVLVDRAFHLICGRSLFIVVCGTLCLVQCSELRVLVLYCVVLCDLESTSVHPQCYRLLPFSLDVTVPYLV